MGQAELLALEGVGDRHVAVLVEVVVDDLLGLVADDDDGFGRARVDQVLEDFFDEERAVDLDEDLRLVVGERLEVRPFARGEYDCLHGKAPSGWHEILCYRVDN